MAGEKTEGQGLTTADALLPKLPEHSSGIFSFWKKFLVNLNS